MPTEVNKYELNAPGESADWSQREFNLLSAFAGLMPVSGSRVVSAGEHFHNILTNQNGVPALFITSEGKVNVCNMEGTNAGVVGIKANASDYNLYLEQHSGEKNWKIGVGSDGSLNFYDDIDDRDRVKFFEYEGAAFMVGISLNADYSDLTAPEAPLDILESNVFDIGIYLRSASVAHGMIEIAPSNAYGRLGLVSRNKGGTYLIGLSDVADSDALRLAGIIGSTSPTAPAIILIGAKSNGATSWTELANEEKVLEINNKDTPLLTVSGNGDIRVIGNATIEGDVFGQKDIYTTKWQSYTPEQFSGFSTVSTSAFKYKEIGDLVFVKYDVRGIGNDAGSDFGTHFSLPVSADEAGVMPIGFAGTGGRPDPNLNIHALGLIISSDNTKLVSVGIGSWGMEINKEYCGNLWYRKKV